MKKGRYIVSILLNVLILGAVGFALSNMLLGFWLGGLLPAKQTLADTFRYFTNASNAFLAFTALIYIICDIVALAGKKKIPAFFGVLKLMATVATTLTMVITVAYLAPTNAMGVGWEVVYDLHAYLWLHAVAPSSRSSPSSSKGRNSFSAPRSSLSSRRSLTAVSWCPFSTSASSPAPRRMTSWSSIPLSGGFPSSGPLASSPASTSSPSCSSRSVRSAMMPFPRKRPPLPKRKSRKSFLLPSSPSLSLSRNRNPNPNPHPSRNPNRNRNPSPHLSPLLRLSRNLNPNPSRNRSRGLNLNPSLSRVPPSLRARA